MISAVWQSIVIEGGNLKKISVEGGTEWGRWPLNSHNSDFIHIIMFTAWLVALGTEDAIEGNRAELPKRIRIREQ